MTEVFTACCALFNEIYETCMTQEVFALVIYVLAFQIMLSLFLYLYHGTKRL